MSRRNEHPIYHVWARMKSRCYNKNHEHYEDYGGRGVVVCERWLNYDNFYNDLCSTYKKGLSLDRFPNNDGNYEPLNCRWATPRQQSLNRRSNHVITCRGITATFIEFSDMSGIKPTAIYNRLSRGWTIEDAIFVPLQKSSCKSIYTKKLEGNTLGVSGKPLIRG